MAVSKVKCPKCKSNSLTLVEVWKNHTINWVQENGFFERNDGILEPGEPYKVEAHCDCGHRWTLRNILQIDQVMTLPTPPHL